MSTNREKLLELLKVANDGLSAEDFTKNFSIIIDLVKKLQASTKQTMDSIDNKYAGEVADVKTESQTELLRTKKEAMDYCMEEFKKLATQIEQKLAEVKDGDPGKDADVHLAALEATTMAVEAVKPLIPTIDAIEADLPKLGPEIRDGLELIPKGSEQLKIEAIYNLREELDDLEKKWRLGSKVTYVGGGGGGGGGGRIVKSYDLSSVLNGVTKVFSLPAMWRIISVHSSSFPNAFRETTDWVYDANAHTITFTSEIEASSTLAAGQTITLIFSE